MQKAMSFNNAAIVFVKVSVYRIHFWYMINDDTINIMNGSNLVDKSGLYKTILLYIKMRECNFIDSADLTYCPKNRDLIPNWAKDYYENDKEKLRGQEVNTETYPKKEK